MYRPGPNLIGTVDHVPTVVEEEVVEKEIEEIVGAKETRQGLFVLTRGLRVPAVGCPSGESPVLRPLPYCREPCSELAAGGEEIGAVEDVDDGEAPGPEPFV